MSKVAAVPAAGRVSAVAVFTRFLVFALARGWGGPVAQIPALREEFAGGAGEGKWASRERFDRALALYQALPGPEATEMCVWLGMQARGRLGGLLAGLGFILPGLVLVTFAAWLYMSVGGAHGAEPAALGVLAGMQAAVAAMIVRAVHKLGAGILKDEWRWGIALAAAFAQAAGVAFWVSLGIGAVVGAAASRTRSAWRVIGVASLAGLVVMGAWSWGHAPVRGGEIGQERVEHGSVDAPVLLASGLRGGVLTFGGAFSLVPILHDEAVERKGWVSDAEFLDAIAITGVLPAPMVMFGTFVAMLAGGWVGALVMTAGLFLPAFAITLVGHGVMERLVEQRGLHGALDGVTSAVVGIMAASGAWIVSSSVRGWVEGVIFAAALAVLYRWRSAWATPVAVGFGAVVGALALR